MLFAGFGLEVLQQCHRQLNGHIVEHLHNVLRGRGGGRNHTHIVQDNSAQARQNPPTQLRLAARTNIHFTTPKKRRK